METKELTIKIKPEERAKAKRKAWELKVYARMSVLALAAMATARLVLLTIDIIQLRAGYRWRRNLHPGLCRDLHLHWLEAQELDGRNQKGETRMYYHECDRCGSRLDPGEVCDCLRQENQARRVTIPPLQRWMENGPTAASAS